MKTLAVLIMTAGFTFSQNDTLSEAIKYYPLETGNYWEYAVHYSQFPYYDDSLFYSIEVTGDTLLSNNKVYKVITQKFIPDNGTIITFERIDTTTACTYRFTNDPIFAENEYLMDSLLADSGDYFAGSYWGNSMSPGIFSTQCTDEYEDTVLGYFTTIKEFVDESGIPAISYLFAKGLGYIHSSSCEFGCSTTNLRYAKIDSVEYGTHITAVDNSNLDQPANYFLYQNYPNPFNPATNIEYSIPHPGLVTLKVYDVLGNEIRTLENEEKTAGRYSISFNGNDLASGIYFYILRAGDFVQSRKMLLLK